MSGPLMAGDDWLVPMCYSAEVLIEEPFPSAISYARRTAPQSLELRVELKAKFTRSLW